MVHIEHMVGAQGDPRVKGRTRGPLFQSWSKAREGLRVILT